MIPAEHSPIDHPHVPPVTTGSYPLRQGNLVQPLVGGLPSFRRIAAAVNAAGHSVWLTVAFYAADFSFPDGEGPLFDLLDRAVARGLDVRIIFWRPNPESSQYGRAFAGTPADRKLLARRGARYKIRWDRAPEAFCQHQKSWLIDAGAATETAFVGGINLTFVALARHDLYVEVAGPAASDVHHNFVQRWNEASERDRDDGAWDDDGALPFPEKLSKPQGESTVQIQRTIHPRCYADGHPAPEAKAYDIAAGERSVLAQYRAAIEAARAAIYIENQALPVPEIARLLEAALRRGVEVVLLVPADPEDRVRAARRDPQRAELFERIEALGRYPNFALVGIAALDEKGQRTAIYVHAKIMLVDDIFATIGSCNLHANSLLGNAEMNASIWDPVAVRALRCQLLAQHLGLDTADLDDRAALRLYRQIAEQNRRGRDQPDFTWQGLAFALSPSEYGRRGIN